MIHNWAVWGNLWSVVIHTVFSVWVAQPITGSARHVQTSHMWRSEPIQQQINIQQSLLGISIHVNIDTLVSGDTKTRSAMIDGSILSIYSERSHHGITYNIFSHPVRQRFGSEPGITTSVCVESGKNLRGCDERTNSRRMARENNSVATVRQTHLLINWPCFEDKEI